MHKSKMRGFSLFLGGLLSAVGIGLYGLDDVTDYEQAQANEAFYCSMAEQEAWPRTTEHPCPPQLVEPGAKLAGL